MHGSFDVIMNGFVKYILRCKVLGWQVCKEILINVSKVPQFLEKSKFE